MSKIAGRHPRSRTNHTHYQEKRLEESRAAVQQQKEAALRTQITHTTPSSSSNSGVKLDPQPSNTDSWSTKAKKEQISRDMARESSARASAQQDSARAGWTGDVVQPQTRGHPLIEQREILRGYLRQVEIYILISDVWSNPDLFNRNLTSGYPR